MTLLKPPAFIAPPYLEPYSDELFIDRPELERRWKRAPILFVSDPLAPMNSSSPAANPRNAPEFIAPVAAASVRA